MPVDTWGESSPSLSNDAGRMMFWPGRHVLGHVDLLLHHADEVVHVEQATVLDVQGMLAESRSLREEHAPKVDVHECRSALHEVPVQHTEPQRCAALSWCRSAHVTGERRAPKYRAESVRQVTVLRRRGLEASCGVCQGRVSGRAESELRTPNLHRQPGRCGAYAEQPSSSAEVARRRRLQRTCDAEPRVLRHTTAAGRRGSRVGVPVAQTHPSGVGLAAPVSAGQGFGALGRRKTGEMIGASVGIGVVIVIVAIALVAIVAMILFRRRRP
jgi:hypothetical protein